MKLRHYVLATAIATVSISSRALPLSVTGDSGRPGAPVVVTLSDAASVDLVAAHVLVQFDPTRLDYVSAVLGSLFPGGTIHTEVLDEQALGRVRLGISSNANPLTGSAGSLLAVNFDILSDAPVGLAQISFRCVPIDPAEPLDAVTDQRSAETLCLPDYAIPATSGTVNVVASAQAPIAGSASLVLLGLVLMAGLRSKHAIAPRAR